jgi:hypothetical protein
VPWCSFPWPSSAWIGGQAVGEPLIQHQRISDQMVGGASSRRLGAVRRGVNLTGEIGTTRKAQLGGRRLSPGCRDKVAVPMARILLKVWAKPDDLSIWPNNEVVDGEKSVGRRRIVENIKFHEALVVIERNQSLQSRPVRFASLSRFFPKSNIDFLHVFSVAQGDSVRTYIVYFVREQIADFLKTTVDGQVDILLCRSTRGRELSYGPGWGLSIGSPKFGWHRVLSGSCIRSGQTKRYDKRQSAEVTAQFERVLDSLS